MQCLFLEWHHYIDKLFSKTSDNQKEPDIVKNDDPLVSGKRLKSNNSSNAIVSKSKHK